MRIIAGELRGRQFASPKGHRTHPMSDKMRGAIFSVLGDINGLSMLDAFAGSGASSLEAISRGVSSALAIDADKNAVQAMKKSSKELNIEKKIKIIQANISSWSENNQEARFDLVVCDPPYDNLRLTTLQKLVKHTKSGGTFILSWPGKLEIPEFMGLELIKSKNYGDSQLAYFRKF